MADAPPPAGVKRERGGAAKGKGGKGVVAPAAPAKESKDAAVCCPLVYGRPWRSGSDGRPMSSTRTSGRYLSGARTAKTWAISWRRSSSSSTRRLPSPCAGDEAALRGQEKGWGRRRMSYSDSFQGPHRKARGVSHIVKLYDGTTPQAANQPVVSEFMMRSSSRTRGNRATRVEFITAIDQTR